MASPSLPKALSDRYRIDRELGRGGMGAVYLATDLRLDRQVAIKVLPPEFAGDAALRDRFLRETRTAASFSHPNVVPVFAVEEDANALAFVMGFVEGESLAARVARSGPLDARSTVRLLQDVAYALAYAHGRGVVHRDIKPDNIMIERATGRALVMDFGIARAITPRNDTPGLTRVGEVVGTPEYMSPEQASGDNVDGRSDLYSLGLVALFGITAHPPIAGDSAQQVIVLQLTETLPPAAELRPDLPPALAEAIDRCVAKEPGARFPSAEALVEAIDAAQLAAPEVPLAIRLFAQEAGTLGLLFMFMAIVSWLFATTVASRSNSIVAYLPIVMLAGVLLTRLLQVRAQATRLGSAGFTPDDVMNGMSAVVEERATVRAAVALDPAVHAHRRQTVRTGLVLIPLSVALYMLALSQRVRGLTGYHLGPGATTVLMTAIALLGVGIVLLIRSPFRPSPGERAFKAVWLGPIGRWFIEHAVRRSGGRSATGFAVATARVTPRTGSAAARHATAAPMASVTLTPGMPSPQPAREAPAPADGRLARIEDRLAAIERALHRALERDH